MKKALLIFALIAAQNTAAMASNNDSADIFYNQGDYKKALQCLLSALDKSQSDTESVKLNNSVGSTYIALGDFTKAAEYYNKSLELCKHITKKVFEENTQIGLGNLYGFKGDYKESRVHFTSALVLARTLNDIDGIAVILTNIAVLDTQEKKYENALQNLFESLKIFQEKKELENVSDALYSIGAVYEEQNNIPVALDYQQQALDYARKSNSKHDVEAGYKVLSELYAKRDDYKNAYKQHLSYVNIKDTLFNEEKNKQIVEMQTKYETEKKEQQLKIQQGEIEKKNTYTLFLFIGILVVAIIAILIYYNLRKTAASKIIVETYSKLIENKNKEITQSIEYAQKIQETILPENVETADAFVLYQPKDIVSGDFYWTETRRESSYYAVADCTGHGVPGALMSIINSELINKAFETASTPGDILTKVNFNLHKKMEQFSRQDGMDICLIRIMDNTLYYAGANRSLYIVRNSELIEIKPDKASIGGDTDKNYIFKTEKFDLRKGDMIYMSTDGYADQFGGSNDKKMGSKGFKNELLTIAHHTPYNQKKMLKATHDNWKQEHNEQTDDICIIGVKI